MGCSFYHSSSITGWANTMPLTRERNFKSIFNAIESLDPDNNYSHHQSLFWTDDQLSEKADTLNGIQQWVNMALNIDSVSKILIEFALSRAIENAKDEKTKEWLTNASNLPNDDDILIIKYFVSDKDDEITEKETLKQQKIQKLESRIKKLEEFSALSEKIQQEYKNELNKLK